MTGTKNEIPVNKRRKNIKPDNSWKTTLISIFGAIILIVAFLLVFLGKASFSEVGSALGAIGVFLAMIGFWFTKDKDVKGAGRRIFGRNNYYNNYDDDEYCEYN